MRSAIKAQQIFETLVRNATSAMFQSKKLKRNDTSTICARKAEFFLNNAVLTLSRRQHDILIDWHGSRTLEFPRDEFVTVRPTDKCVTT